MQQIAPANAKLSLARAESSMGLWMAHGKQFEFQGEKRESPVLRIFRIMPAQRAQASCGIFVPAEKGIDGFDALLDPMLQQRKENIFLAIKARIESAARITRS